MALIQNAKGRRENQTPSGYTRLFGIEALGQLVSRIHGASISAGTELEKLILERVNKIDDLDKFVLKSQDFNKKKIWVANKRQVKKSTLINSKYEPDFLAFDLVKSTCFIIEIKDGDQFDTKKAAGEYTTLHNFMNDVSKSLPFTTITYICSFNSKTKKEVFDGLKHKFPINEVITGSEFCKLVGINFNEIVKIRKNDQKKNLDYFLNSLLKISSLKVILTKLVNK